MDGGNDNDHNTAPIKGNTMDNSSNRGSGKSSRVVGTMTSSDDVYDSQKLQSGAVFFEIMNSKAHRDEVT
ncbi:hypothetical protein NL676_005301 [Syzygium grande]|nr:hypothetical protein NL676_005301 [Syzygium grande]